MKAADILAPVNVKICCTCKEQKQLTEFNKGTGSLGKANNCRACCVLYRLKYRAENKEKLRDSDRAHYEKNRSRILQATAEYRAANANAVAAAKKLCYQKKKDEYKARIRAQQSSPRGKALRLAAHARWEKHKKAVDPVYALKRRVYSCIGAAFAGKNFTKRSRTHKILGCGWSEFREHIEKQFLKGMTWENRSEWHLDHIVPIATAKTVEDVEALNHFTNFRPLWAVDNMLKSDHVTHLI